MIPHFKPRMQDPEIAAVTAALRAGCLSQGTEVAALENELSAMFDGAEAVVVASGTAALYLALAAMDIERGSSVIVPSYTCNSMYAAAVHAGLLPVCADTPPAAVSIERSGVEQVFDNRARAVIVSHTCGYEADTAGVCALSERVIEDCAHSLGGRYGDGSLMGTRGIISILSFYATKMLPSGEGGACITRRRSLAETIRQLRNCDERPLDKRAFNMKMSDLCAALARARLRRLAEDMERREQIAWLYDDAFGAAALRNVTEQVQRACFRYLIESDNADSFVARAEAAGIACRRPVFRPLHMSLGGACPHTERLHDRIVSVPLYPALTEAEIEAVCTRLPKLL
jgi:dTDP-4-amino-4,6-dideoxygalactose transaminase